jgi:hypothetical protein
MMKQLGKGKMPSLPPQLAGASTAGGGRPGRRPKRKRR